MSDAKAYTGHSFRRTSATLLADSGADITTLKRHGAWESTSVAEGYIENSVQSKRKIGQQIASSITSTTSNKQCIQEPPPPPLKKSKPETEETPGNVIFN